jgi:hypothetical protein
MELAIAILGGLIGGLVTQFGEFLRSRSNRRDRWVPPVRDAAVALIGYYGSLRDELVAAALRGSTVAPYEVFFVNRAGLTAALLTLPSTDELDAPLRAFAEQLREFHRAVCETPQDQAAIARYRTSTYETMRTFETAVRARLERG